jgi:hypothetical protein
MAIVSAVACVGTLLPLPSGESLAGVIALLEEPADKTSCAGITNVRGWAFSDTGATIVSPLEVKIDGVASIEVPCCSSRADVRSVFPVAPVRSGFSGIFNWGLRAPGSHLVEVVINSNSAEKTTVSATCTSQRTGPASLLQDFDLDNDGAADCVSIGREICCDGVLAIAPPAASTPNQVCDNVCYSWAKSSQSLVMTSAICAPE